MKAKLATVIGHLVFKYDVALKTHHKASVPLDMHIDDALNGQEFICDDCKLNFVPDTWGSKYDTSSGELEPGCLYWESDLPENYYWDNHKGPHLMAVLPNGMRWNIDSRANNCTMKDDRTHRCWVRHGEPPNVHVGKDGHTCQAGAGSILVNQGTPTEWHGFLHHGEFHT